MNLDEYSKKMMEFEGAVPDRNNALLSAAFGVVIRHGSFADQFAGTPNATDQDVKEIVGGCLWFINLLVVAMKWPFQYSADSARTFEDGRLGPCDTPTLALCLVAS